MKKAKKWFDLWGELKVLDNAYEVRIRNLSSDTLSDLEGASRINNLSLEKSKDIIDLSKLNTIGHIEGISLCDLKFINLAALDKKKDLKTLSFDGCIVDFQDIAGFESLEELFFSNCKVANYDRFVFPKLKTLYLVDTNVESLSFISTYENLEWLQICGSWFDDKKILPGDLGIRNLTIYTTGLKDLSVIGSYKNLEWFGLSDSLVTDLQPILKLKNLKRLEVSDELINKAIADHGFVVPINPQRVRKLDPLRDEIEGIFSNKDWEGFYSLNASKQLGTFLSQYFDGRSDLEEMACLLGHPDREVLGLVFLHGLNSMSSRSNKAFRELLSSGRFNLIGPFRMVIEALLKKETFSYRYMPFRVCNAHFSMLEVLKNTSPPGSELVYHDLLNLRKGFSDGHLALYKRLLDLVSKTKDASLVDPILVLLNYERKVIGGDLIFIKKILKAIGNLGFKNDAATLRLIIKNNEEHRAEVLDLYLATIAKLEKKKK